MRLQEFLGETHRGCDTLQTQNDLRKYIPTEESKEFQLDDLLWTAEADAIHEAKGLEKLLSLDNRGANFSLQSNQEITVFRPQ